MLRRFPKTKGHESFRPGPLCCLFHAPALGLTVASASLRRALEVSRRCLMTNRSEIMMRKLKKMVEDLESRISDLEDDVARLKRKARG